MKFIITILTLLLLNIGQNSVAHPGDGGEHKIIMKKPTVRFLPYVPEKKEYGFELGAMWENQNLYWMAFSYGHHIGKCMFYTTQNCQQYVDAIVGVGGSELLTNNLLLGSLRWQFVSFPRVFSPTFRIYAGGARVRDDDRDVVQGTYGIGYGFTTSMHENLDFRTELRMGRGSQVYGQIFLSFALKIDKWVDYYADRINNIGSSSTTVVKDAGKTTGKVVKGTVDTTGKVLKATVTAPVEVTKWLLLMEKKTDKKAKDKDKEKSKSEKKEETSEKPKSQP